MSHEEVHDFSFSDPFSSSRTNNKNGDSVFGR